MTNAQIEAIEQSGSVSPLVEIKANVSGIVMTKRVNQGDYVASGAVLFDIANLSRYGRCSTLSKLTCLS